MPTVKKPTTTAVKHVHLLAPPAADSPIQWMAVLCDERAIYRLMFGFQTQRQAEQATEDWLKDPHVVRHEIGMPIPNGPDQWLQQLERFSRGEQADLDSLPLDLTHLTEFGRSVTEACRAVRWGQTSTYKQLAVAAGSPGASRAVGSVMAHNRFPLIVPCHRITGSSGKLTGFSAPGGIRTKQALLDWESVELSLFS